MQRTGLLLPAFQETQINHEAFVELFHKEIPVRLLQSSGNINTLRIIFRIYPETYQGKLLQNRPKRVLSR